MSLITAPGIYPDLTYEDYFAEPCPAPALSNSGIRTLLATCPAKFAHGHPAIGAKNEPRPDTAPMRLGSIVHRIALGKGQDYVECPFDSFRTKEAREWKAQAEADGLIPVTAEKLEQAHDMASRIADAINAETRGEAYDTEVVIAWRWPIAGTVIWCRAMIDVWCPSLNLALDVKTCADASDRAVERTFANGYAGQAAFYSDGLEAVAKGAERPSFRFLFVENEAPFLTRAAQCSEGFLQGAAMQNEHAAAIFARCLSDGRWPGYAPLTATPPAWWLSQNIDLELEAA